MTIEYQTESWHPFFEEAHDIFPQHWAELALDKDKVHLALDEERYDAMDKAGIIHLVTARSGGKLVGYYIAFLLPHVHYKNAGLMAFTDIYYMLPEYRRASAGAMLFIEAERTMKQRGVTKAYLSCKVHQDHSQLFQALGWTFSDKAFTKYIG